MREMLSKGKYRRLIQVDMPYEQRQWYSSHLYQVIIIQKAIRAYLCRLKLQEKQKTSHQEYFKTSDFQKNSAECFDLITEKERLRHKKDTVSFTCGGSYYGEWIGDYRDGYGI